MRKNNLTIIGVILAVILTVGYILIYLSVQSKENTESTPDIILSNDLPQGLKLLDTKQKNGALPINISEEDTGRDNPFGQF
ncbi:hypothetical protein CO101_01020 [Candidatus Berkelbacteria bacterium CG_4_9_14_3_um_filter_39_23]|uniref:Uncharacterized protein n=2 Tax=Candidatus Berkelbacteria TaxID=1618330 RepID=A0A2M7CHU4_9BACT|nr:hypothetical protein [Candidatus Berkelbacteria bacterium]OIP04674.1 MAG: hypothetical protein AUK14_03020 [Candidatus Berkelbacteria bacterium CG2_30_39_44]PIR27865.1 MAG: hypothetical protein COV39_02255 [Candidatus Berkelbacteria bacterium CG11_big_fil_rev_8_21_14_0_20_40_23]PIV25197.1 MAG: hypothetical protein COS38_02905 [Candidatus Berkelbacteria bacterium CG03_land_8_20_14_0_80_40_36]PIX30716.1 MAG: hypothetical protein COZ62_01170 [Candidatus Berkelbacteria bacterium CG_4_8_14_3_um_f